LPNQGVFTFELKSASHLITAMLPLEHHQPVLELIFFHFNLTFIHVLSPLCSFILQAVKLWWKNVQFIQHPRYTVPTYRDEALVRDRKLQCCGLSDYNLHVQQRRSNEDCLAETSPKDRWFRWIDAKWPWS
jgi:hypothetical protein